MSAFSLLTNEVIPRFCTLPSHLIAIWAVHVSQDMTLIPTACQSVSNYMWANLEHFVVEMKPLERYTLLSKARFSLLCPRCSPLLKEDRPFQKRSHRSKYRLYRLKPISVGYWSWGLSLPLTSNFLNKEGWPSVTISGVRILFFGQQDEFRGMSKSRKLPTHGSRSKIILRWANVRTARILTNIPHKRSSSPPPRELRARCVAASEWF